MNLPVPKNIINNYKMENKYTQERYLADLRMAEARSRGLFVYEYTIHHNWDSKPHNPGILKANAKTAPCIPQPIVKPPGNVKSQVIPNLTKPQKHNGPGIPESIVKPNDYHTYSR
jgi:hypothetical protein